MGKTHWTMAAEDWLFIMVNAKSARQHTPALAAALQACAEQFLTDLARDEHAEREAARDEAYGK